MREAGSRSSNLMVRSPNPPAASFAVGLNKLNPETGSFETIMPLSDDDLQKKELRRESSLELPSKR